MKMDVWMKLDLPGTPRQHLSLLLPQLHLNNMVTSMSSIMTATTHLLLFTMKVVQKLWNFHLDTLAAHPRAICLATDKPAPIYQVEAMEAALVAVSHLQYTNHGSLHI